MVFLNGLFIEKNKACISVMDRGFLFGDAVYEVIPVYKKKIFYLNKHLERLQNSLDLIQIKNPYTVNKWKSILNKLINSSLEKNQLIYLHITRGVDIIRNKDFNKLSPTIYIESNKLNLKAKDVLKKGFSAISREDIRWGKCNIKSTSLLANILYSQTAKQNKSEEVILTRDNKITEGASSNVFMLKNNELLTHPADNKIISGITRYLIIKSLKACNINFLEKSFSLEDAYNADGLWISSASRELMPINILDNKMINKGIVCEKWDCVYDQYQNLKNGG